MGLSAFYVQHVFSIVLILTWNKIVILGEMQILRWRLIDESKYENFDGDIVAINYGCFGLWTS